MVHLVFQPHIVQPAGQATASQRLFCTPHPKNGQYMFYYTDAEGNPTQASFIPFSTSTPLGRPRQRGTNKSKSVVRKLKYELCHHDMRKPAFCIYMQKQKCRSAAQHGNRAADQRLCFLYKDSIIPLLTKSQISSLY